MTAKELRAMTAQGPAVVMVTKEDMLRLLDAATTRTRLLWLYRVSFWLLAATVLSLVAILAFMPSTAFLDLPT
jgi:hypothetical protein